MMYLIIVNYALSDMYVVICKLTQDYNRFVNNVILLFLDVIYSIFLADFWIIDSSSK